VSITVDISRHTLKETFEVTGVHLEEYKWYIINFCEERHPIDLVHEPDNKYTDFAVQVYHKGNKIGYISRYENEEAFRLMQKDHTTIISFKNYFNDYLTLEVAVYY